jgi:uncharacterized protein
MDLRQTSGIGSNAPPCGTFLDLIDASQVDNLEAFILEVGRIWIFSKAVMLDGDLAHDENHLARVAVNAAILANAEGAAIDVVIPAALLHDLVNVPKNSPNRERASKLSARVAKEWMHAEGFDENRVEAVAHCIEAHSMSAQIAPQTLEAKVVQDADRLDALGSHGIRRAIQVGDQIGRSFFRSPGIAYSNGESTIEHLKRRTPLVVNGLQTATGKAMAVQASAQVYKFIEQIEHAFGLLH